MWWSFLAPVQRGSVLKSLHNNLDRIVHNGQRQKLFKVSWWAAAELRPQGGKSKIYEILGIQYVSFILIFVLQ